MFGFGIDFSSVFFFSSRRRHTRWNCDWSSDVCSSDLAGEQVGGELLAVDDDGVTRVVAAGRAHDVVDRLGGREQVGGLALALVAPLGAEDHDPGHRSEERRVGKEWSSWGATNAEKERM